MSATASSALLYNFEPPLSTTTTGIGADRQFLVDEKHFRFTSSIFHLDRLVADTANCLGPPPRVVHAANCLTRNGSVSRITRDVLAILFTCTTQEIPFVLQNLAFLADAR